MAIKRNRWNSALVTAYAHELALHFDRSPDGRTAAELFRVVEGQGRDNATVGIEISHAHRRAFDLNPFYRLGNWLEAGRVAARLGEYEFFRSEASLAMAAVAPRLRGLSSDERHALKRVQAFTSVRQMDLIRVEHAFSEALRVLSD